MTTFNIGDTVRRTRNHSSGNSQFRAGTEFVITALQPSGDGVYSGTAADGNRVAHLAENLELVRAAGEPANVDPATLQPGDVVRLTGDRWNTTPRGSQPAAGNEVTILSRDDQWSTIGPAFRTTATGSTYYLYGNWTAELVRRATITVSDLHVGDVVAPAAEGGLWDSTQRGVEGTVTRVTHDRASVNVPDGKYGYVSDTNWPFVLIHRTAEPEPALEVTEPPTSLEARFPIGSTVRRTRRGTNAGRSPGDTFIVGGHYISGSEEMVIDANPPAESGGRHLPQYLELVSLPAEPITAPAVTFDRYTPAMLPMFTIVADAADRAGHCSEYDDLAAVIGAPNRAEIRRLNRPAAPQVDGLYATRAQLASSSPVLYKRISARWIRIEAFTHGSTREVRENELPEGLVAIGEVTS